VKGLLAMTQNDGCGNALAKLIGVCLVIVAAFFYYMAWQAMLEKLMEIAYMGYAIGTVCALFALFLFIGPSKS
jgi:hypothetical protein